MSLREQIIHESLKLFSLRGFLSTSINDILDAANTSKGGFYNHFASKEALFHEALAAAQQIWRDKVLAGLDDIDSPVEKVQKILENYCDRYLKDEEHFPGGCVFVTFSVELDDQRPHLSAEVNKGFAGFKKMLKRLLDEAMARNELNNTVSAQRITEMLFAGMLGASVIYSMEKSPKSLDRSLNALIDYLEKLKLVETITPRTR